MVVPVTGLWPWELAEMAGEWVLAPGPLLKSRTFAVRMAASDTDISGTWTWSCC
jgi:hypothetical protein